MTITRAGRDLPEDRPFWVAASAYTHVLLRMGAALLFIQHGGQKLFGWFGGVNGEGMTAPLASQFGAAGVIELAGGGLLLLGLLTRPVAVILAAEMVTAYLLVHNPQGGLPIQNQGELALLYGLIFLYFLGNGAGRLSVDHALAHRETTEFQPGVMERADVAAGSAEGRRRGHAA